MTLDEGIRSAAKRAARERTAAIAVYTDGPDILVRDAKAAVPRTARLQCITSYWEERTTSVVVQVRYAGAESTWIEVDHDDD